MLEDGLLDFRNQGCAFETHNSLTTSSNIVPYPVNPTHWFTYYVMLRGFSDAMYYGTIPDNLPVLYLHANVYFPLNVQLNVFVFLKCFYLILHLQCIFLNTSNFVSFLWLPRQFLTKRSLSRM